MITSILKQEIKNRFSHWSIILIYGLLIFQGIWFTKGTFDFLINEDLFMNASAIFYKNLAGAGMILIIIVAVLTGPILFKEIQYKTGQWLFTNPIDEKKFFLGRFLAAFCVNSLVALAFIVGMLLVPYSGIGEAHQFGPAPIGQLLHGYFFLLLPNILLLTSSVFFALVFFKKMTAGYLFVIITVIIYIVMQSTAQASGASPILMLGDPFAQVAVDNAIDFMTIGERNYGYLKFTNYLILNRIIWLSLSAVLIVSACRKFSFKWFLKKESKKKIVKEFDKPYFPKSTDISILSKNYKTKFSFIEFSKKLFRLSIFEIKNVVRPSNFKIIIGIVVLMNILQNLLWNASYYIGPTEPLTFTMTNFRLPFGIFIIILIMVWASELFFKDRTVNFWYIADALPIPTWVVTLSRLIAMSVAALILAFVFMLTGIFTQIIMGGVNLIDLRLYAYDFFGYNWGWLTYVMHISLVFFIAGLTKNRMATNIISVGILFLTIIAFELGLAEQIIYAFAAVPGIEDYSEISGYGVWTIAAKWYFLMWALLSVCFIFAGVWFWQRGSKSGSRSFSLFNHQLSWGGKMVLLCLIVGFIATRWHIIQEVNVKGKFALSEEKEREQTEYEIKYNYLKSTSHPKYKQIDLNFDFYPNERKAVYLADLILSNYDRADTLYLNWSDFVEVSQLTMSGKEVKPIFEDSELNVSAYLIPNTTDSLVYLNLKAKKQYARFIQSGIDLQADLMFNGSFGSIKDFLPTIGYDYHRELKQNRKRTDNGLEKLTSRMARITDSVALGQDAFMPDAEWVTGSIKISTIESQNVIAPGELVNEWIENNRKHYHFEVKNPQPFNWYLGSSEYDNLKTENENVSLEISYDRKHPFNVELYQEVASKAIRFIKQNLGEFPTRQIRIYEIPYYQKPFYSFPNAIAISEKEGWYAKTDALNEKAYIYQTISSQMIKQWIQANISVGNVQGADMLRIALPEALAMVFVEQELGKEAVDIILQKKKDKYVKEKNNEANQMQALLYADGTEYQEQYKGAIVLYQTVQEIGSSKFYKYLLEWTTKDNGSKTFKDFIDNLRPELNAETYDKFLLKEKSN